MNKKLVKAGIVCGVLLGTTVIAYAITTLFFTKSVTSQLSKKMVVQFGRDTDMAATEVGPGESFDVRPVVTSDATEEMYVFIQVDMPETVDGALYAFEANPEWIPVGDRDGRIVYAYTDSEVTPLQPGDSTSALTEQMTMKSISNAEYAAIDDINITIPGYAMGTEDVSANPTEAWEQCKLIGNIQ